MHSDSTDGLITAMPNLVLAVLQYCSNPGQSVAFLRQIGAAAITEGPSMYSKLSLFLRFLDPICKFEELQGCRSILNAANVGPCTLLISFLHILCM
jgi:hypothetical protein